LVARLAKDLTVRHGKGFSRSNVMMMRAFCLAFPNVQTLSGLLSGSHYVELLSIDDTLELGKGFTFVGRQYRITLNNTHYRVDLVFYHRILRCFVLIDLKINDVEHHDIGQMNMYLGYFATEENSEGDNPPIGIILTRNKDELLVEYATYQMNSQLFVQKYQLYLPDREELRRELELTLQLAEDRASEEN